MDSNKIIIAGFLLMTVIASAVSGVKTFYYRNDGDSRPSVVDHQPQTINIGKLTPRVPLSDAQKKLSDDWWETDDLQSAESTLSVYLIKRPVQEEDKQTDLTDNFNWKDIESSESALNFKFEPFVQSAIGSSTHGKFVGQPDPKDTKVYHKTVPSTAKDDNKRVSEELSDYGSDEEFYDDEPVSSETSQNKGPIEAIITLTPITETIKTNPKAESDLNTSESVVASKVNQIEKLVLKTEPTEIITGFTSKPTPEEVSNQKAQQDGHILSSSVDVISQSNKALKLETAESIAFIPLEKLNQNAPFRVTLKDQNIATEHKAIASHKDSSAEKVELTQESTVTDSEAVPNADRAKSISELSSSQNEESSSDSSEVTVEVEHEIIPVEISEQFSEESNAYAVPVEYQPTETSSFVKPKFYKLLPKPQPAVFRDEELKPTFDYRETDIETSTSPKSFIVDLPELTEREINRSHSHFPREESKHRNPEINWETEINLPLVKHTQLREPIPYSHSQSKFGNGDKLTLHIPTSDSLSLASEQSKSSSELPSNPPSIQNDELPSNDPIDYQHPSTAAPLTNERGEKLMGLFFRTKPPTVPIPQTFDQPIFYHNASIKKKPIGPSHEFGHPKKPDIEKEQRPFDSNPDVTEHRPPAIPLKSHSLPNQHSSPFLEETRVYHPSNQPTFEQHNPFQNPLPSALTQIIEPLHSVVRLPGLRPEPTSTQNYFNNAPNGQRFVNGEEYFAAQRSVAPREPFRHFPKAEHQRIPFLRPGELHSPRPFVTHPQQSDRVNTHLIQQGHFRQQFNRPSSQHSQSENVRHENPTDDLQQESSFSSTFSNAPVVTDDSRQPQSQQFNPSPVDNSRQSPPPAESKLVYPVPMAFRTRFQKTD